MKICFFLAFLFGSVSAFACDGYVCKGDRVHFGNYAGTAVEVFSNKMVQIAVDGHYDYTYKASLELGVGFRCSSNLCVGDRVNFGNYVGTVSEIFSDGFVKIAVDEHVGYTFKAIGELGFALDCHN